MTYMNDNFPGSKETTKFDIICKGEIALSQFFLEKNTTSPVLNGQMKPFLTKVKQLGLRTLKKM